MTNLITLALSETGWNAIYSGPHARAVEDVFGTNVIPTAFTARMPLHNVIAELSRRNPGVVVKHFGE